MKNLLIFLGLIVLNSCSTTEEPLFNPNQNNSNNSGTPTTPQTGNTHPQPVAKFTVNKLECILPCQVNFTNQSTNATSYVWEFGEHGVNKQAYNDQYNKTNPVWVYTTHGEKYVKLEAKSSYGQYNTSLIINIYAPITRGGRYIGLGGGIKIESKGYDLQVTYSQNPRIPIGLYKRSSPEESTMEIYYAYSGDSKKRFYDRAYSGGGRVGGIEWKDAIGSTNYNICDPTVSQCNW